MLRRSITFSTLPVLGSIVVLVLLLFRPFDGTSVLVACLALFTLAISVTAARKAAQVDRERGNGE